MSGHQQFTPEQLERIASAVNFTLASTDGPLMPGTVVRDVLRTQDLMSTRSGVVASVERSSYVGVFQLPPEIRNKIYRYCLVVGEVYPRPKANQDDRLNSLSVFQKPQTQVFEVCRQIFAEAAPIYFAENKFILSYGLLPWSQEAFDDRSKPVSRVAHQNLRSLSITFDVRDCQILPDHLRANYNDGQFEDVLERAWDNLVDLVRCCELQLLEVSFRNCYCAFCHDRKVSFAMLCLMLGIANSQRVVLTGFLDSGEVSFFRGFIDHGGDGFSGNGTRVQWHPGYDDEDPNDKLRIAFQVAWN